MTEEHTFNNRYKIERRLGDGGMAVVYAGSDVLLRRRVAIKVLREQYAADEDFVRRFYYEAQSAAKLSHPNIVNTYDVGREGDTYFIVMELVDGTTLAEMIRADGRLPEPVAIDYAAQICNGLAYAHRQGLLHRDIKPANILITHDDVVKLSDFGIARAVTQQTLTVTQPGMVMGSVYYLSPEQAQGLELRETSDLYSVGVVLYQMLSGRLPFVGDSPVTVALKHVSEAVPPLGADDGASPALAAVVARLLEKDPGDRFGSASDVASALREARERPMVASAAPAGSGTATTAIPRLGERPVRPPPRRTRSEGPGGSNGAATIEVEPIPRRRWRTRTVVGLLVALLLAVAGGYALFTAPIPFMRVAVADETGRTSIDAQRDLEGSGLHVKLAPVSSDTVEHDKVVRQDPLPGTLVGTGGEVVLYVSSGTAPKELANVVGFNSVADAQKTLESSGFKTKIDEKYSDKPKGTVVATSPNPGERVAPGSLVTMIVSKGPAPLAVPDVVGQSIGDAQKVMIRAKFGVTVKRVAIDGIPPDQVASQDPAPGAMLEPGGNVTLTVSTGPGLSQIPNVGGKALADASEAVQSAGFVPKITYSVQQGGDGTVMQQDPAPNTQAPKGTPVNIIVAVSGLVPDVTGMTLDAAKTALTRFGYQPGNITYVPEGDEGHVVRTEPIANTRLSVGESVVLYVAGAPVPR